MKAKLLIAGVIGAAIGSAVTYILTRYYYENKVYEVIPFEPEKKEDSDETKEEPEPQEEIENTVDPKDLSVKEYARKLQKRDEYVNYGTPMTEAEKEAERIKTSVKCIPYQEYFENEDWAEDTLYYYEDGVLADENDQIIDDKVAEEQLGKDWSKSFSLYDDDSDSAYFVNEDFEMYYEVLRSAKYYYGDVVPDDNES